MGKVARPQIAGGLYHVYSRGNGRAAIFLDDADYATFLRLLEDVVERFEWLCHGFCLMPNHYHLLLETPEPNLARGMQVLNLAYARSFNWRYARPGHVFQGPYRSPLVRREAHLVELCRYIVLNPVRAGLVAHPAGWRWTSYRATAGLEPPPAYLSTERVLGFFGDVTAFRSFVLAPITVLDLAA
ncbi:MAG: REP-associated tyrosine transposase [Gaiellaceae bacterium]|jgi:REP element-mobilizing transposase RayT|nr:REP-associated tyrosine transposase [Gaiellaceae bacterium]